VVARRQPLQLRQHGKSTSLRNCFAFRSNIRAVNYVDFWATVCKTVRPMLSIRCLSCPVLSVCDVVALWSNGWTDQDETWRAGRLRPRTYYVRWGPISPTASQFSAHICCGQRAAWIKMPLRMEVGLGPGDFVLDGDAAPLLQIFGPYVLY